MKKRLLILLFPLFISTISFPGAVQVSNKQNVFHRTLYAAKSWICQERNRKKLFQAGMVLLAVSAGVGFGLYLKSKCKSRVHSVKTDDGIKAATDDGIKAAGVFLFKKFEGRILVLLGLNCNNHWQDCGGLRDKGETVKETALREGTEELCLYCDNPTNLKKDFKIEDTQTYKMITAQLKNPEAFSVEYKELNPYVKKTGYRLFVTPIAAGADFNNATFQTNRDYVLTNQNKFASNGEPLLETRQIEWFDAQKLSDCLAPKELNKHADFTANEKIYVIRGACIGSFKEGLKALLK